MDNITHSLVGALTAETALSVLKIRKPEFQITRKTKIVFWLSALIANNICDLDFVISFVLKPSRLQYLLHHRGHTHTVLLLLFQAGLIFFGFWIWTKLKKVSWEKEEILGVVGLTLVGGVLHLVLDFLNQYGVHPFWPFYSGWFFADIMFIVEPSLWMTLIPFLFYSGSHRYFRLLLVSLLGAGLALEWFTGFVPKAIAIGMTIWSLFLMWGFRSWSKKTQLVVCYASLGLIGLLFSLESFWLKQEIKKLFFKEQPDIAVNDVILSPFPSNPICWQVVTVVTSKNRKTFSLRKGVVSLFTNLYRPSECLELISKTVKVSQTHPQVIWTTQFNLDRRELIKLHQTNCFVAAQLRFVRAPFWYRRDGKLYFADLRFETESRDNFSKLEIPETTTDCPKLIPPWSEPRRDLLSN